MVARPKGGSCTPWLGRYSLPHRPPLGCPLTPAMEEGEGGAEGCVASRVRAPSPRSTDPPTACTHPPYSPHRLLCTGSCSDCRALAPRRPIRLRGKEGSAATVVLRAAVARDCLLVSSPTAFCRRFWGFCYVRFEWLRAVCVCAAAEGGVGVCVASCKLVLPCRASRAEPPLTVSALAPWDFAVGVTQLCLWLARRGRWHRDPVRSHTRTRASLRIGNTVTFQYALLARGQRSHPRDDHAACFPFALHTRMQCSAWRG